MKKSRFVSVLTLAALLLAVIAFAVVPAFAANETEAGTAVLTAGTPEASAEEKAADPTSSKAIAAAAVVGIVGAAGAIAMGIAISKSTESMARQPDAAGKINSAMMLGLVFIETAIIYALIVAILIFFVL